jgi:hypothetical protein
LTQACYAFVVEYLKGRSWMMLVILGTPALAGMTLTLRFLEITVKLYKESLLLFAAHSLSVAIVLVAMAAVIELYSERRFVEFEIL